MPAIYRQGMALNPADMNAWIAEHGPYLEHWTRKENVPRILREGLKPPEYGEDYDGEDPEANPHSWGGFYQTRPDHVYLGTPGFIKPGFHKNERDQRVYEVPLRVDLRKLDPTKLKADEDQARRMWSDWISDNPTNPLGGWMEENHPPDAGMWGPGLQDLGNWADEVDLDEEPWVNDSLREGSIAHEGPIPPEAISLHPDYMDKYPEEALTVNQNQMNLFSGSSPLYHVAPIEHRDRIKQWGLQPVSPSSPYSVTQAFPHQPKGVYLWQDLKNAKSWAEDRDRETQGSHYDYFPQHDIWEVNPEGIAFQRDKVLPNALVTPQVIGPESLTLRQNLHDPYWEYEDYRESGSAFFSEPHSDLDSTFWEDNKLKSDFSEKIRDDFDDALSKFKKVDDWASLWIAGSVTGYQYIDDDSDPDLDVQVVIDFESFKEANPSYRDEDWQDVRKELHAAISDIDGEKLTGEIELNYFIRPETDIEEWIADAHDLGQGVYSVDNDEWEIKPQKNPEQTHIFKEDIKWIPEGERLVDKANDLISAYEEDKSEKHFKQLKRLYHKLHKGRKDSFSGNGGQYGKGQFLWQWMYEWGPMEKLKDIVGAHQYKTKSNVETEDLIKWSLSDNHFDSCAHERIERSWKHWGRVSGGDWFCPAYGIPDEVKEQIQEWAKQLPWDERAKLQDPNRYHITSFYSLSGYSNPANHEWVQSQAGLSYPAYTHSMAMFGSPNKEGLSPIVMRFHAPELSANAEELMDQAEQRGLPVARFEGGHKPHITLGHNPTEIAAQPPRINFQTEPLHELHRYYDSLR